MRIFKRSTFFALLFALTASALIFVATPAFAQSADFVAFGEAAGFTTEASITVIIARLIRTAITLTGVVTVAFMVYGGFVLITAGGDPERVKKAKKIITNAVIGLLLVFASFAIVSFVLGALTEATDGDISNEGGTNFGFYSDGDGPSVFSLNSVNTQCAEALKNLQLQFVFSKTVDADTVQEGIVIEDSSGVAVDGTFFTSGRTVTFTPSTPCDSPYETEFCFEASSDYSINVDSTIVESSTGSSLTCTTEFPCSFTFTTGTEVDVADPTVDMDAPEDGESVYAGSIEMLQALTRDDSGVSTVDFYVIDDDEAVYSSGIDHSTAGALTGGDVENAFFTDIGQEWDTEGYTTNETYNVWATGYDCAGNADTASIVKVVLRAANCNNGTIDVDLGETDIDCGGDSSSSYYCGSCDGESCSADSECASGQCVDGQCVTTPKIQHVSPGDGAPSNLVTISGEGFGDDAGSVWFLGTETGDEYEVSAYECNGVVQWTDEQIIVQLPIGAADGPVSVTTGSFESERTDDDYGPLIADFDVNAIERPGLCTLNPDGGEYETLVDVYGNSLGEDQGSSAFYFTNYETSSYLSWSDEQLEVVVPNINSGTYRTQVFTGDFVCVDVKNGSTGLLCSEDTDCDMDAGESCATSWCSQSLEYCKQDDDCGDEGGTCESIRVGSNEVDFIVADVSSDETPIISYVDSGWSACADDGVRCGEDDDCGANTTCDDAPNWGPPGQYITIYGTGFGTSVGSVNFENVSLGYSALGDADFPDFCGDDFWHDTYITVKVPDSYVTQTENPIETVTHAVTVERADGLESNAVDFVVLDDTPGPAICDINPSSAPAGEEITVFGENFGTIEGVVTFYNLQEAGHSLWENDEISQVVVPADAVTGSVYVTEALNGYDSNSLAFTVGDCRDDASLCAEGESCCSNGVCSSSCGDLTQVAAHYAFRITTGITPNTPHVVVACTQEGVSPAPWEGWSDPEDICVNSAIEAEFDREMDQDTINATTVLLERCTQTSQEQDCDVWEAVGGSVFTDTTGFSFDPDGELAPSTRHRVTLKGEDQIASADGGYLEEDYEWEFTTSSSGALCEVGDVNVRPHEYTQTEQGYVDYSAQLISQGDTCVALSCSGYTLYWDSVDDEVFIPAAQGSEACTNEVYAQEETPLDDPATITATVTNSENEPSGSGELTINFLDPEIDDYFPQCSTACVNALPWGEFNTEMDDSTIDETSVTLYVCSNSLCETSTLIETDIVDSISYSSGTQKFSINFKEGETMTADTWYRVVVNGDEVLSYTGVPLSESGSNYGSDENRYFEDDFSWIFKTKETAVSCAVDSVTLDPEVATMSYVGERAEFEATAQGAPDDCSVEGQTFQSGSYTWEAWEAMDSPNTVGARSGDESSQEEIVAYMIQDGEIELTRSIPAYCTAACLNAGAPVTTSEGVCGNGIVEDAEKCDDGLTENGDGCSSICLNEGSLTNCGNGIRDFRESEGGEDCDDGNTISGDGCSSLCLNEGARSVGAECGDGVRDWAQNTGGEDCDDGNSTSGDGCSSNCLLEGSSSEEDVFAICGDGIVDQGEDCDFGDFTDDDGCSSLCLNEGTGLCPTSLSNNCCGNGKIETGEDCDGEEGCSNVCLWAGSSYAYSTPSFCGDGDATGIGEECDASATALFSIGDYGVSQVATGAPLEVDETTGYAISTISVRADEASGSASLLLQCSCSTDDSCQVTGIGCGEKNCCYERPTLVESGIAPADNTSDFEAGGDGYCRNTAVYVTFSDAMDESTFDANLYLDLISVDLDGDGDQDRINDSSDCPDVYITEAGEDDGLSAWNVWRWLKKLVLGLFGREANASITFACHLPVTYELTQDNGGNQRVHLRYSQLLEANALYRLVVVGDANGSDSLKDGVLAQSNVTLCLGEACEDDGFVQEFAVGEDICELDRVVVEDTGNVDAAEYEDPSIEYFSAIGEEHAFTVTPQTYRAGTGYEEISPLTDLYEWEWTWTSSENDEEDGDVVAAALESPEDTSRHYTASGASGFEHVLSTATITVDEVFETSTVNTTVTGILEVTAIVCENPWPALESTTLGFPYIEDELPSNFSFYYCRDAGETGMDDDLPALEDPIDVTSLDDSGILQELIFKVDGSRDAIGVRVLPNANYLTPLAWVADQEFTGSFSQTELDGYPAVSSGNTTYVAAANVDGSTVYSNMYIVSYNQDASDEAEQIFDQILSHWRFNGNTDEVTDVNLCLDETTGSYVTDANSDYIDCQWDGDCFDVCETEGCSANVGNIVCDAQKGKLTRDMVRLLDVVDLSTTLDEYGSAHRHCEVTTGQSCDEDEDCPGSEACVPAFPTVQSGTFVPALSNSIWSSWNASLANELGTSIPVDPINEFYDCSEEGFDEASCWNGEEGTFLCPENSHVYGYQSIGGEAYNLYAVLESQGSSYTWAKAIDVGLSDEATVYVEYPTAYAPSSAPSGFSMSPVWCDGSRWGDSTLCGDGTQGSLEACEIGDTMVVSCTDGSGATGVITVACLSDCSAYQSETEAEAEGAACEPYACGNGVVEIGEICDDGDLNGTYGHCDDLCGAGDSIYCGDGYLASSEACDCGTTTTFATVIADENSWAAINACDVSNGQYSSSIDVSCAYNCTQPGLACGDGRTNGSEDCDGDYEDWEGSLCSDGRTTCTSDDDCEGLDTCGDTGYETPGIGFVCVGGDDAGYECERDSDCESEVCSTNTYNLYRYRVCESDCTWPAGWTGPVGGDQQCGNGIVEGDEACDDGNTSNNDECLNTCVKNICGDDYMLIGVESCDDGEQNGIPCEADYEDSCNYCDVACVYKTTSGGYCGDGVVDPGEMCDGGYATLLTYYDVGTDLTAGSCDDPDTSITKEGIVYSCHWLGICDGGEENGDRCTLDYDKWTVNGGIPTEISDNIFNDSNSCSGGECVPPVCADDCGSSCPVDYVTTGLLVQSEAEGALPTDSISLYSYLNSEGNSPDNGVLYVPACTVATSISADIDDSDVNPPDVDIVFVTDLTGSMDNLIGDSRKIDLAVESTVNAIEDLFDAYSLTDSSMRIGLVSYTTDYSDVSGFCNTSVSVPDGAFTDSPLVDDSFESELISLVESYATCVSPQSGSTPTYNGLQEAVELMNSSTAEVQVIIILTDGDYDWIDEAEGTDGWDEDEQCGSNYIKDFNNHRFFAKSACAADMYDELVKDSDIFFYTAAITSNDEMQALTAHISSNECEWDEGSDSPDDATSAARDSTDCTGNYAYTAETDDAIQLMYEAIVDSILGTQVTFTATNADGETTTTTGEVQAGENVVLPFPDGFVCQSREQDIPLRNVFYGDGMMSFSDFNLTYCPYQ